MQNNKVYENFPVWIPFLSCILSIAIYTLGAFIFSQLAIIFTFLYLLFCLWIEFRILQKSCVNCCYYGKICGLGRGKLCPLFFKKRDPERFKDKQISWKDLIPDFLVLIFPLVGGIIILSMDFTWPIFILIVILIVLSLGGNALIRGSLACKYCKQRELGCPAEQLFNKSTKMSSS